LGGPVGREQARRIDARVSGLPGLAGLNILEHSLDVRGIPA
jgi:hypothetical protein